MKNLIAQHSGPFVEHDTFLEADRIACARANAEFRTMFTAHLENDRYVVLTREELDAHPDVVCATGAFPE